jgi:S-methylmethionine-dependent homocysteine/selenocysteine methylase
MPCLWHLPCADYDQDGIITAAAYLKHAAAWVAAGVDVIGGCCGIGPQHMQLLVDSL